MPEKNQMIVLARRPSGMPTEDTFELQNIDMPGIKDGEALLESLYISVDPGMRGFMNEGKSDKTGEKFQLGDPITSRSVAKVIESRSDKFKEGDIVHGRLAWKKYQSTAADKLEIVDPELGPVSTAVSILGVTGLAAYFGLMKVGKIQKNETVVVSGAAGAVGSAAVQIAKIHGCRVVGIAGSEKKIAYLEKESGIDKGVNYKKSEEFLKNLSLACPDGVDVFFDNVGGKIFDAVFSLINRKARMVICGQIAEYNESEPAQGPRPQHKLINKSALIEGFVVFDYKDEFEQAKRQLAEWFRDGRLKYKENLIEGFENLPQAFIGLFKGENIGKQMVKV